jgi:hypothetical protein
MVKNAKKMNKNYVQMIILMIFLLVTVNKSTVIIIKMNRIKIRIVKIINSKNTLLY